MAPVNDKYKQEIVDFIRKMDPIECDKFWKSMGCSDILEYVKPLDLTEGDINPLPSKKEQNRKILKLMNKFKRLQNQQIDYGHIYR